MTHVAACIRCGRRVYGLHALDTLAKQDIRDKAREHEDAGPDVRDVFPDAQQSWLEFQLFAAVHSLKEFDANHYLVRVIEAAVTPNYEGERSPVSLLRNQAG